MKIIVRAHGSGWQAFVDGFLGTWEFGPTPEAAIGKLITTYARCFPERGMGLVVEERP